MPHGRVDRMIVVAAGEQERLRAGEAPVRAQDAQQMRREHHVAILPTLAVTHQDDAAAAVNVRDPEPRDLRGAQPRRISRRQRGAVLQARHRFKKLHDLIGAEHDRQLARLARVGDAFRKARFAQRDPVEEAQSADDLVQAGPRDAVETRWTWKAWTSSRVSLSGERPKWRLN